MINNSGSLFGLNSNDCGADDLCSFVQGILLFDPKVGATPEKMTRLWIHEVYRVFYDRLVDQQDRRRFFDIVKVCF